MSKHPSRKPARALSRVKKLAEGTRRHVPAGRRFHVDGVLHDRTSALAAFDEIVKAHEGVEQARTLVSQRVLARDRVDAKHRKLVEQYPDAMRHNFGEAVLADFGIRLPRERRKLTAEEKARASAEGVRTRRARGSYTSRKQREEITLEGRPGLAIVSPEGEVKVVLPPAPPGQRRPKK